jgi:hypothetical protein
VILSQEEELSTKSRDTEEEIVKLNDQVEDLQREKETLEVSNIIIRNFLLHSSLLYFKGTYFFNGNIAHST